MVEDPIPSRFQKVTDLNRHGVKNSADLWRTFNGEHYPQYWSDPSPSLIADLRQCGVRCRRIGTELFVHNADIEKAGAIQADHDRRRATERGQVKT